MPEVIRNLESLSSYGRIMMTLWNSTPGVNDDAISIYKFLDYLSPLKAPYLRGKPKLVFIQACRGGWMFFLWNINNFISFLTVSFLVHHTHFGLSRFFSSLKNDLTFYKCSESRLSLSSKMIFVLNVISFALSEIEYEASGPDNFENFSLRSMNFIIFWNMKCVDFTVELLYYSMGEFCMVRGDHPSRKICCHNSNQGYHIRAYFAPAPWCGTFSLSN